MTQLKLTKTDLFEGVWRGIIRSKTAQKPEIEVTHKGSLLPGIQLTKNERAGHWNLEITIPAQAISDGVQVLLIRDAREDEQIGEIALLAGEPLDADVRANLAQLRAELDLLKQAFRRHCRNTA